jgi:hypothetical protein
MLIAEIERSLTMKSIQTRILPKLALSLSLATGLVAGTSTAFAESPTSTMTVNVPFAFSANRISLPAGAYTVQASEHFLKFTNAATNKTLVVVIRRDDGTANHGPSRLTFHKVNGQTYLSQVWTEGTSLHTELLSHPKINREIAQLTQPETTFEIATK